MVSTLIVSPASGSTVDPGKDMVVSIRTDNLVTGFFNRRGAGGWWGDGVADAFHSCITLAH
jgi:hypothetical protein